jgi:hypothetical protein
VIYGQRGREGVHEWALRDVARKPDAPRPPMPMALPRGAGPGWGTSTTWSAGTGASCTCTATVLRFDHGRLVDIAAFEQPSMFSAFGLPASM